MTRKHGHTAYFDLRTVGFTLDAAFIFTSSLLAAVVHYLVNALEFVVHDGLGLPNPVWGDVWVIHHPVDDETGRQPPF
jgi:hypothetical protein